MQNKTHFYHGTSQPIDIQDIQQRTDSMIWLTDSPAIANCYASRDSWRFQVNPVQSDIRFWGVDGRPIARDEAFLKSIGAEPLVLNARHSGQSEPVCFRYKNKLCDSIPMDDYLEWLTSLGYYRSGSNPIFVNVSVSSEQITPFKDNLKAFLFEFEVKEPLHLLDRATCASLREYNNHQLFSITLNAGYDGVIIRDQVLTDELGLVEHGSVAIFNHALAKFKISKHEVNKQRFDTFQELSRFNEVALEYFDGVASGNYEHKHPTLALLQQNQEVITNLVNCSNSVRELKRIQVGDIALAYMPTSPYCAQIISCDDKHEIRLSDKFFELDANGRAHVILHEVAHIAADEFDIQFIIDMSHANAFGEVVDGNITTGINGTFTPLECMTESIAVYFEDPLFLKNRYPLAYACINEAALFGKLSAQTKTEIISSAQSQLANAQSQLANRMEV